MNNKIRINKYLAEKGITTRRGADDLIRAGKVYINSKLAELGSQVSEVDKVEVRGAEKQNYKYFIYYKPVGQMTEEIVEDRKLGKLFPVGRLDKESHGLIILTNDGRITDRLLNPKFEHEKEYEVTVKGKLRSSFKNKMEAGVQIEDYKTKPCKVTILSENKFNVVLTEGKKHQIRRMCVALFQEVADLKRTRIMNIKLDTLRPKQTREIKGAELKKFFSLLGLN